MSARKWHNITDSSAHEGRRSGEKTKIILDREQRAASLLESGFRERPRSNLLENQIRGVNG